MKNIKYTGIALWDANESEYKIQIHDASGNMLEEFQSPTPFRLNGLDSTLEEMEKHAVKVAKDMLLEQGLTGRIIHTKLF